MKRTLLALAVLIFVLSCAHTPEWRLSWEENFDSPQIDTSVWSTISRGTAAWRDTQSSDARCYDWRDGKLVLRGIVNDDRTVDTAAYLTGGLWTKGKKAFHRGRIEIRARLQAARGAWPALWLMPYEEERYHWPEGGEIDIMERLNFDSVVYQTVHSHYTYTLGIQDPVSSSTAPIRPDDFNVYGVDMWPDSIVFHVNGIRNYAYPRIETDKSGQFPFDIPQYLIVDMQLRGPWVGPVDPEDLPVEMEIDWIRYYEWK